MLLKLLVLLNKIIVQDIHHQMIVSMQLLMEIAFGMLEEFVSQSLKYNVQIIQEHH